MMLGRLNRKADTAFVNRIHTMDQGEIKNVYVKNYACQYLFLKILNVVSKFFDRVGSPGSSQ